MLPTIRLEIEGLKQSIVAAIATNHAEIEEHVQRVLENVVSTFDFEKVIKHHAEVQIEKAVTQAVEMFFSYGAGNRVIKEAVQERLTAALMGSSSDDT